MIPWVFLSKMMDVYDVEINGSHVKTTVVTETSMVEPALKEFRASISLTTRLVGIEILSRPFSAAEMLVLHAGASCLIFRLHMIGTTALANFLGDRTLCFVTLKSTPAEPLFSTAEISRIGELVGRTLKKTGIRMSDNLEEIAKVIGHGVEVPDCPSGCKTNKYSLYRVFSPEEVKYIIQDAYCVWLLTTKLYEILSEETGPVIKGPKLERN